MNLILIQSKIVITVFIINEKVCLSVITPFGIFWKHIAIKQFIFSNFKNVFTLGGNFNSKITMRSIVHTILFLKYNASFFQRYYIKLRGLGFFIKYLSKPKHFLLLYVGFSHLLYLKYHVIFYD